MNSNSKLNSDDLWWLLHEACILLNEASIKLSMGKDDGPSQFQSMCNSLEESLDDIADGIHGLMEDIEPSTPLTEKDQTIAQCIEQNAMLRATIKKLMKQIPNAGPNTNTGTSDSGT